MKQRDMPQKLEEIYEFDTQNLLTFIIKVITEPICWFDGVNLMTKTDATKKFQTAKALAAQKYFSIVSPYIETIQKTDQEFREIAKKMNKAKRKKP